MTESSGFKCPLAQNKGYTLVNVFEHDIVKLGESYSHEQALEISSQDGAECENCFFNKKCAPEPNTLPVHGKVLNKLIGIAGREIKYYPSQTVNTKSVLPASLYT